MYDIFENVETCVNKLSHVLLQFLKLCASVSRSQIENESSIKRTRVLSFKKKNKFRPCTIMKQHHLQPTDFQQRLNFHN